MLAEQTQYVTVKNAALKGRLKPAHLCCLCSSDVFNQWCGTFMLQIDVFVFHDLYFPNSCCHMCYHRDQYSCFEHRASGML